MTSDSARRPSSITATWLAVMAAMAALGVALPVRAGTELNAASSSKALDPGTVEAPQGRSNHVTLGAGAAWLPRFQGSEEHKIQPLPLVDVKLGRFFAKTGDGIGVNILEIPIATAGLSVNWMPGYDKKDIPGGIRDLDSALGARAFIVGRYKGMTATLAVTQAVTEKDRGLIVSAGAAYPIRATERLTVTPSIATSWANGKYMGSYFGVSALEAKASGLDRYQPSGGLKDVSFRITVNYRITDSINLVGSVGAITLVDKAADSPLVEKKTQPIALAGLTYRF